MRDRPGFPTAAQGGHRRCESVTEQNCHPRQSAGVRRWHETHQKNSSLLRRPCWVSPVSRDTILPLFFSLAAPFKSPSVQQHSRGLDSAGDVVVFIVSSDQVHRCQCCILKTYLLRCHVDGRFFVRARTAKPPANFNLSFAL